MENIIRPLYLNHITNLLDKGMMLFLVGQRRVGKSFLLRQVKDWIIENIDNSNIVYINKESHEFGEIKTWQQLATYVDKNLTVNKKNYLLIDEVQDIDQFEIALRSYYSEDKCQIIATGSNAYVFSTELSTRLSGRYIEIPIYSLTYLEFLKFHSLEDSDKSLLDYLRVGGLPALSRFNIYDDSEVRDYLSGVYNTVMVKDIIDRNGIRNTQFANNLTKFVADNIGKPISPSSIYKFMRAHDVTVSQTVVSDYLHYLCEALLIVPIARYDIHGKRLFENIYKYYFSDHGLRNYLVGFNIASSIEKIMENVVWHHLVCQGFKVTIGMLRAGEIDFIATKGDKRIYIQVTYLIASEETEKREFGNLLKIKDNNPKYVISLDPIIQGNPASRNGIRHIHLRDFLKAEL